MKVTISDVARLAGVSTATVSTPSTRPATSPARPRRRSTGLSRSWATRRTPRPEASGPERKKPLDLSFRIFPISFSQR
ncbi:MAG: LacI family DNA-binding transcriptional regulator [Dysosmobacter sp.]